MVRNKEGRISPPPEDVDRIADAIWSDEMQYYQSQVKDFDSFNEAWDRYMGDFELTNKQKRILKPSVWFDMTDKHKSISTSGSQYFRKTKDGEDEYLTRVFFKQRGKTVTRYRGSNGRFGSIN